MRAALTLAAIPLPLLVWAVWPKATVPIMAQSRRDGGRACAAHG